MAAGTLPPSSNTLRQVLVETILAICLLSYLGPTDAALSRCSHADVAFCDVSVRR